MLDYYFLASSVGDLLKLQEEVTEERDQLLSEVVELRQSLAEITEQQQETEKAKNEAEQSVLQVCTDHQTVILGFVLSLSSHLQLISSD